MNDFNQPDRCPICGGLKEPGKTIFSVDLGFGVVVVRDVPATICSQCASDWIEDKVADQLEQIVNEARKRHPVIEVASFQSLHH
jgi:YgiT-type zinc finger domain-containing protein